MSVNFQGNHKKTIRVFLITPYRMIQQCLKTLIEDKGNMKIVGVLNEADNLSADIKNSDVVVIYLLSSDSRMIEIIPQILNINPQTRVVVVADSADLSNQARALELGAVGIVKKEANAQLLLEAIRNTHHGETSISQALLNKLLNQNASKDKAKNKLPANSSGISSLTAREKEVITMIGKGLKNKDIADRLTISEATIRHHLSSIYGKLEVEDRLNLVIYAYQYGLIKITE